MSVTGSNQKRRDVNVVAVGGRGRSPDNAGRAGLDQKCEDRSQLARAQGVVGGNLLGKGHGELRVARNRRSADALEDHPAALSPETGLPFLVPLEHPGRSPRDCAARQGPVMRRRKDDGGRLMPFVRERPGVQGRLFAPLRGQARASVDGAAKRRKPPIESGLRGLAAGLSSRVSTLRTCLRP